MFTSQHNSDPVATALNDFISGKYKGRSERREINPALKGPEQFAKPKWNLHSRRQSAIRDIILVYTHVKYYSDLISDVIFQQKFNHVQLKGISF